MKAVSIAILLLWAYSLVGQEKNHAAIYQDTILKNYIASVQFRVAGAELSMPIIDLSDGQLHLSFDDLDGDTKNFYYTIIHCDRNWQPSKDVSEMDYIDGFTEEEIDNYEFSVNTIQPYTHYELLLPNENMRWKLSGNYILKVYTDKGTDDVVFTRRFIVVDNKVRVIAEVNRAFNLGQMKTHQEIDFVIDHKGFDIPNPKQELSVSILQNGMWWNMKSGIQPLFIKKDRLEYDYQGKITFQGLREFRFFDIRSFRFKTERVAGIQNHNEGTDIFLVAERKRHGQVLTSFIDMNGNYIIESMDNTVNQDRLESDYALVHFYFPQHYELDGDVYILGKMSDWQLKDSYKMEYIQEKKSYFKSVYLKQGFYNYLLAYVPKGTKEIDIDEIEGNDFRTENDYTILVYYKPFGSRYDQVISAQTFSSVRQ